MSKMVKEKYPRKSTEVKVGNHLRKRKKWAKRMAEKSRVNEAGNYTKPTMHQRLLKN